VSYGRSPYVSVGIDSVGQLGVLLLGVVVLGGILVVGGLLLAQRVELAVLRYDFWLDLQGVPRRRRRELRRELRQNLDDAAQRVGSRTAVRQLGSLRALAAEGAEAVHRPGTPRWSRAGVAAALAFGVVAVLEMLAVLWWVSAADSSGAATVSGALPLFPGSAVEYSETATSTALEVQPGWLVLAAAGATFAVVSRPWLLLTGRVRTPRAPA
jgi:hypothetical protein